MEENTNTETVKPAEPVLTTQPAEELISIEDFMKVKLKSGIIEAAEIMPKSKKMLKLQVNLGPVLGKKQILSGIGKHYTPESLIGKKIVVVANLKPATLMGELSEGMLLAASNDDSSVLAVVEAGANIEPGYEVR